ncbi:MAG: sugar phosphate isomerase/epimerase [Clostridia bacterium]|nr:sugar phosphate isomerase/epimerase [Clostridia bacterium]
MRFGNCTTTPAEVVLLKKYGYTFAEANFQFVREMPEEEFHALLQTVRDTGVTVAGMNCFATPDVRILNWTDDEADAYFESGVKRAKPLGLEYVVIGSGGARKIPEGMKREAGLARLVELLRRFGDIAEQYDVDIYLEPLRHFETDVINTVLEAVEICKQVGHPRVGCMADFYHMAMVEEPFSDIARADGYLRHIHVAIAPDRTIPLLKDSAQVEAMAKALRAIGYGGRIVLEGAAKPDMDTALREFSEQFSTFE